MAMNKTTKELFLVASITAGVSVLFNVLGKFYLEKKVLPKLKKQVRPRPTDSMLPGTEGPATEGIIKE